MSAITTHVLNTSLGGPGENLAITLEELGTDGTWAQVGQGATNADGRLPTLLADDYKVKATQYRITFDTGAYFAARSEKTFYPSVSISFDLGDTNAHYHVPLLISNYGYSTYRGS